MALVIIAIARAAERAVVAFRDGALHAGAIGRQFAALVVEALMDLRVCAERHRFRRIPRFLIERQFSVFTLRTQFRACSAARLALRRSERTIRAGVTVVGALVRRKAPHGAQFGLIRFPSALAPFRTRLHAR